jgi:hypothetical protein
MYPNDLPLYSPRERDSNTDLVGVRSQLDLRGLLSEEAFVRLLKASGAGPGLVP